MYRTSTIIIVIYENIDRVNWLTKPIKIQIRSVYSGIKSSLELIYYSQDLPTMVIDFNEEKTVKKTLIRL